MKQIAKFLTIAALVLAGAIAISCTQQEQTTPRTITQTITVSLDEGPAGTRAVDPATGSKTFTTSDRIAVLYRIANHPGMVNYCAYSNSCTVSTDGKKATFTVTLEDPVENSPIRIIYPSGRLNSGLPFDEEFDFSDDEKTLYLDECRLKESTASFIDSPLEVATFDGALDGTNLPTEVWLRNRVAFLALTVKNSTGTANITNLSYLDVGDGKRSYSINAEFNVQTIKNGVPIYVAIYPVAPTDTLTITAEDNTGKRYGKIITGKTLERGNIYPVTVMMNEQINLAAFTDTYTANDGDILYGCFNQGDGHGVINIPDGATVMLAGVNYGQTDKKTYIQCAGSAHLILYSGLSIYSRYNNLNAPSGSNYPAIHVPQGKTLSISGNGNLWATSPCGAAIGAGTDLPCGNIIISSGYITAKTTEPSSAAIGAGASAAATSGNIVITKDVKSLNVSGPYFICNGFAGDYSAVTIDGKTGPSGFSFTTSTTQFPHLKSELISTTEWELSKQ